MQLLADQGHDGDARALLQRALATQTRFGSAIGEVRSLLLDVRLAARSSAADRDVRVAAARQRIDHWAANAPRSPIAADSAKSSAAGMPGYRNSPFVVHEHRPSLRIAAIMRIAHSSPCTAGGARGGVSYRVFSISAEPPHLRSQ